MKPIKAEKTILMINDESINVTDLSLNTDTIPNIQPIHICSSKDYECTVSLKINRWNRFKLWVWCLRHRFKNIKSYEIKLKQNEVIK